MNPAAGLSVRISRRIARLSSRRAAPLMDKECHPRQSEMSERESGGDAPNAEGLAVPHRG